LKTAELKYFKAKEKQLEVIQSTHDKYKSNEIHKSTKKSKALTAIKKTKFKTGPKPRSHLQKPKSIGLRKPSLSSANSTHFSESLAMTDVETSAASNRMIDDVTFDLTQVGTSFDHLRLDSHIEPPGMTTVIDDPDAFSFMDVGIQTQSQPASTTVIDNSREFDDFQSIATQRQFATSTQYSQVSAVQSDHRPNHISNEHVGADLKPKKIDLKTMRDSDIYSIRVHKDSELVHLNKMPKNFWKTMMNHKFWYDKFDDWN
jgi:hypothetical protein